MAAQPTTMQESRQSPPDRSEKRTLLMLGLPAALLLIGWLLNTPPGLLGKMDAIGYAVCHRIDVRSFHLGDRPISLCARCTGMYLGAVLGLVFQFTAGRRRTGNPPKEIIIAFAVLVLAFVVDGNNSFSALLLGHGLLYEPNNTLRLITGSGMGLGMAAALVPIFNQTVWAEYSPRAALENWRQFALLLGLMGILILLVLSENPLVLYPLAIISALGVPLLLTLLYTVLVLSLRKSENQANSPRDLLAPLLAGFLLGLMQIAALDVVRFWLTGTWEGFHVILG